jgi:hypothetical protein
MTSETAAYGDDASGIAQIGNKMESELLLSLAKSIPSDYIEIVREKVPRR